MTTKTITNTNTNTDGGNNMDNIYANVKPVALDFAPKKNTRPSYLDTPWPEWVDSAVKGDWAGITIPNNEEIIKQTTADCRAAVRAVGLGVAIRLIESGDTVTFAYCVKDKRLYNKSN